MKTNINATLGIYNIPEYAYNYPHWVINNIDGELWFYGAYNDLYQAKRAVREVNFRFLVEVQTQ